MTRILQFICCITAISFFIACDSKQHSESNSKESNSQTEYVPTLRVGVNAEYPPFEFKKDDEIVGFDIDVLEYISKRAGFKYTLHHMSSFDGLIPALKAGKIDMIISSMTATAERAKQVDFTLPYYEGKSLYLKHKDSLDLNSKEDVRGKRVGVFIGTIQEQTVNNMKDEYDLEVVPSDTIFASIMNLKNKKVDVVVADHATSVGYIKENNELQGFYQEGDGGDGLSIAVDKGKHPDIIEKVNIAIQELKQSPEYNEIIDKYKMK
ncbi:transporter substrate-binding domain-containing protein [Helicobacter muridarum]|uniref:Amino acid ABC superfamily ATP binding cassette transporter, binding protein n=1 Tax=Helicobacter muridarum TaxID=216 RepID=A0A099TWT0_9HELI|nr:transporter substrate-binding domain-containing protein [Helicobacter muridarum]TLD99259.1 transporter substrate-binding domain-containing protein [Helicobacter muridarum]STQ86154.1 amino acid ABC superfamily ATP binding cassette transporter, binding protein [Helicobacter muridarum]